MTLALILVGLGILTTAFAVVIDKHRSQKASKNGNGYEKLEEYTRTCKCKGAD